MTQMTIRNAEEADIGPLTSIKGASSEALHKDRLRDAHEPGFRYIVLEVDGEIIGYACLVFRRPAYWSDAGDVENLPQIVDLRVKGTHQGKGLGSAFIHHLEDLTVGAGHKQIFISVEPDRNPRAYTLYQRLGYRPLQSEPYQKTWEFSDSAGIVRRGKDWVIDMVKQL